MPTKVMVEMEQISELGLKIKDATKGLKRLKKVFDKFTITVKEFGEAMNKIKWEGDEKLWQ